MLLTARTTAVLVIDTQVDYCDRNGVLPAFFKWDTSPLEAMLDRLPPFVERARNAGTTIIFVRMIEDMDYMLPNAVAKELSRPEPHLRICTPGTPGFEYYRIQPKAGDPWVIKNDYGAFLSRRAHALLISKGIETPLLETILESRNIETLVCAGDYTSRCVDSTLRRGFALGYNCVAPRDLVAMPVELAHEHEASLRVCAAIFGTVLNSDEIEFC